jgi:hypothetical protein
MRYRLVKRQRMWVVKCSRRFDENQIRRNIMPCQCHQKKSQVVQQKSQANPSNSGAKPGGSSPPQTRPAFASIRYTGPASTTVTGAISGRAYNFARNGAVVQVDARDKPALAKVPHLRQI